MLFSQPFSHECCLMISQWLLQAVKARPREGAGAISLMLTSHWLNLSHMAVSTCKGSWEIECLTSPISIVHAGKERLEPYYSNCRREGKTNFSKANTDTL